MEAKLKLWQNVDRAKVAETLETQGTVGYCGVSGFNDPAGTSMTGLKQPPVMPMNASPRRKKSSSARPNG